MFKKTARGGSYNAQLPCTIAHRAQLPTGRNYQCAGRVPEALVGETTGRARASWGEAGVAGAVWSPSCVSLQLLIPFCLPSVRDSAPGMDLHTANRRANGPRTIQGGTVDRKFTDPHPETY